MRTVAKDESEISRQARWQRKHRAMGLCVLCSKPAFKGWRCRKHYEQHKITMRLRYIPKVRGRYDVGGLAPKPAKPRPAKAPAAGRSRVSAAARSTDGAAAPRTEGMRRMKTVGAKVRSTAANSGARRARATAADGAAASSGAAKAARRNPPRTGTAAKASPGNPLAPGNPRPGRTPRGASGAGADRRNGG